MCKDKDMTDYRESNPLEEGFISDQDEFEAMRDFAQHMLHMTDPNDILDTLLLIANVCETRAMGANSVPDIAEWYQKVAILIRVSVDSLQTTFALPNAKIENPALYFPDIKAIS